MHVPSCTPQACSAAGWGAFTFTPASAGGECAHRRAVKLEHSMSFRLGTEPPKRMHAHMHTHTGGQVCAGCRQKWDAQGVERDTTPPAPPPTAPGPLQISVKQLLTNTRLLERTVRHESVLAGEPCSLPPKLLHSSETSCSATQLQSNLSFILQSGLLVRFHNLLVTWQMDLLWHLHPLKTTLHKQCRTTHCP